MKLLHYAFASAKNQYMQLWGYFYNESIFQGLEWEMTMPTLIISIVNRCQKKTLFVTVKLNLKEHFQCNSGNRARNKIQNIQFNITYNLYIRKVETLVPV